MTLSVPLILACLLLVLRIGSAFAAIDSKEDREMREMASEISAFHRVQEIRAKRPPLQAPPIAPPPTAPPRFDRSAALERQPAPRIAVNWNPKHATVVPKTTFGLPAPSVKSPTPQIEPPSRLRPPAFVVPHSAIDYLMRDGSLTREQRGAVVNAIRDHERDDQAYLERLRERLETLISELSGTMDETTAQRVADMIDERREIERRLLNRTLKRLRAELTPTQWRRVAAWVRQRPWMPFYRSSDIEDATD